MPLRGTVTAAEEARHLAGTGRWVFRVETKRRADAAWTDLSNVAGGDWTVAISTEADAPDRPVSGFTVKLIRAADGQSLAPGMSASPLNRDDGNVFKPLIYPGRLIRAFAANLAAGQTRAQAVWHPWLVGEVERVEWPSDNVTATCTTLDGVLQRVQIEEEEERGADDPGTPLATEIQGLLDRWMGAGAVSLLTVGDPQQGVGKYKTPKGPLGTFLLQQAQRIGWDLRYRWDDASASFRLTLYLPPRNKTTADLSLTPGHVFEIPGLSVDRENIRNAATIVYSDAATGKRETVKVKDDASIAEFGRAWMGIDEAGESSINSKARAETLGGYAISDLAQPLVEKRVRFPFLPFLALHHTIQLAADGARFDYPVLYSVVGVSHEVDADSGSSTVAALRGGSPVGQYHAWRRRQGFETDESTYAVEIQNHQETPATKTYRIVAGAGISEIRAAVETYLVIGGPADPLALVKAAVRPLQTLSNAVKQADGSWLLTVNKPAEGQETLGVVEGRYWKGDTLAFGDPKRFKVDGIAAPIDITAPVFDESPDGTTTAFSFKVVDPRGITGTPVYYLTRGVVGSVEQGPFPLLLASGTWSDSFALDPDHPVRVRIQVPRTDGLAAVEFGPYTSDADKVPGIPVVSEQRTADVAVLLVDGVDTDTASLWRLPVDSDNVATGPEVQVAARGGDPRFGAFTVTATSVVQRFRVYGKNSALVTGPYRDVRVDPYVAPATAASPPSLDVTVVVTATQYTFSWVGDGVALSIGGAAHVIPPASPFTVQRPAATAAPIPYSFRATKNGINASNGFEVQPVGVDVAAPDLVVTPSGTTATAQTYAASAINTQTGAGVPVTVRLTGCTGTNNGALLPADTSQAVNGPIVVNRPAFGAGPGTAAFVAQLSNGARETIQRTIPPQQQLGGVMREDTADAGLVGTLTLTPVAGARFDLLRYKTRSGNGGWSDWITISGNPPYTASVALVEKHTSLIAYEVSLSGIVVQQNVVPFDVGSIANVMDAIPAYEAGTATVASVHDTDTAQTTDGARWRVDGGAWTTYEVAATRRGTFTVPQTTTGTREVEVQGRTPAGVWGPSFPLTIERYAPPPTAAPRIVEAYAERTNWGACASTDLQNPGGVAQPAEHTVTYSVFGPLGGFAVVLQISTDGGAWEDAATLGTGQSLVATVNPTGGIHAPGHPQAVVHTYAYRIVVRLGSVLADLLQAGSVTDSVYNCT